MRPTRRHVTTMFMGSAVILLLAALGYAQTATPVASGAPLPDPGLLMLVTTGLMGLVSIGPGTRS